jgi:hypothetical protein
LDGRITRGSWHHETYALFVRRLRNKMLYFINNQYLGLL